MRRFRCCLSGFVCVVGLWLAIFGTGLAQTSSDGTYVVRADRVIDLRSGVEWLRCSVGQRYQDGACVGEVLRLNQDEAAEAVRIANWAAYGACLPVKNLNIWSAPAVMPQRLTRRYFPARCQSPIGPDRKTGFHRKISGQ